MGKKLFLLVMLFAFTFLASGCITVYTDGCCPKRPPGAKEAFKKGVEAVEKVDNWVEDNLW